MSGEKGQVIKMAKKTQSKKEKDLAVLAEMNKKWSFAFRGMKKEIEKAMQCINEELCLSMHAEPGFFVTKGFNDLPSEAVAYLLYESAAYQDNLYPFAEELFADMPGIESAFYWRYDEKPYERNYIYSKSGTQKVLGFTAYPNGINVHDDDLFVRIAEEEGSTVYLGDYHAKTLFAKNRFGVSLDEVRSHLRKLIVNENKRISENAEEAENEGPWWFKFFTNHTCFLTFDAEVYHGIEANQELAVYGDINVDYAFLTGEPMGGALVVYDSNWNFPKGLALISDLFKRDK